MVGMPYPLMWGGVIALLNYIPYFGPIVAALLMALGGLMTFTDIWMAMVPPGIMIGCHLVEANVGRRLIVGHRRTINRLMILVPLGSWGGIWATPGALPAVPLRILMRTVIGAAGRPATAGFRFE